MNLNNKRPSQFELFPGATVKVSEPGKSGLIFKGLTVSLENIIVINIISLMIIIFFFSLGVERGKRSIVATKKNDEEQNLRKRFATDAEPSQKISLSIPHEDAEGGKGVDELQKPSGLVDSQMKKNVTESEQKEESLHQQEKLKEEAYTIQVASFKLERSARDEATKLKEIGYDIFVLPKGDYSIVCVGKFAQRNEAQDFSKKLRDKYRDCLIRRM